MQLITQHFPNLSAQQIAQFEQLGDLYPFWNKQINVISRKDIEHLYEKHILHSLGIAKVISFVDGTKLLDVGTGGGFPGIPLAILFPNCQFHCVDSIGKKIKVVNEIAQAIGLENLKATHTRAENVNGHFDFVISRAVTRLSPFIEWVKGKISLKNKNTLPNGILYLKGGDIHEELADVKQDYNIYPLDTYFETPFFETKLVVWVKLKGRY